MRNVLLAIEPEPGMLVETVADVYGLDRKMAVAMFDSAAGFPQPPPVCDAFFFGLMPVAPLP